jgi:hypothetical protein
MTMKYDNLVFLLLLKDFMNSFLLTRVATMFCPGMIITRWHSAGTSELNLSGSLPAGRKEFWNKPGATHKARFMVSGI